MKTEDLIPPLRDLPPGRLETRKRHLISEIAHESRWTPAGRRLTPLARRPRSRLVLAAIAISALVAAPALALRFGVIDFSTATPATPRVVEEFSSLSKGAPPGMDPRVVAGETRMVGELLGHRLWVAPTRSGGLCYVFAKAGGGCDTLGTGPLSVTWASAGATLAGRPRSFGRVEGFVHSRWADDVEISLDDGSTVHPHVIWVSPPIDAGFFLYEAPTGKAITAVRALKEGTVTSADVGGAGPSPGPHPFADLSKKTEVASVEASDGRVTLWTAPTLTEGRCAWLQYGSRDIPVAPCLPKGYEHQAALALAVHALGGHSILAGECGYSAVEFVHRDGTVRSVPCSDGLVFSDLDPSDAAGNLRAVDADGHPLPGSTTPVPPPIAQP